MRLRVPLLPLGPRDQLRAGRLPRRITQLMIGLALYGASMAMMVRSTLGLDPWDVFHYGLAQRLPLSFGRCRSWSARWCCWPGSRCGSGRAWAPSRTCS